MDQQPENATALFSVTPSPEQFLKQSGGGQILLPTPVASEGTKAPSQQTSKTKSKTGQVWLSNVAKDIEEENALLPTIKARDSQAEGYEAGLRRSQPQVGTIVKGIVDGDQRITGKLLPTPITTDSKQNASPAALNRKSPALGATVHSTAWGKFEPAIRRWEQILGRPAPAPTKPDGKDGNHRLSSLFTEWMMGLPEGWITGCGLKRNDELKAAGNGVVPQQAELALRILLGDLPIVAERERERMMPTPTVHDNRDGKHLRSVAVENLRKGKNRGVGLNHLVETIGVDWKDGDTFTVDENGVTKNERNESP